MPRQLPYKHRARGQSRYPVHLDCSAAAWSWRVQTILWSFQDTLVWAHTVIPVSSGYTQVKANSSALPVTSPSQEKKSLALGVLFLGSFFLLSLTPHPFFTSHTPAIFHLNISSSCLAASAACQVSSGSQRRHESGAENCESGKSGGSVGSETSAGDKKWKGGEDGGVITNVLPVYFLLSAVISTQTHTHTHSDWEI